MKRISLLGKIILGTLIVVAMCMSVSADDVLMDGGGFFDPVETKGDLNLDDYVDMNDAILLLQHSMFPDLYPLSYTGSVDFTHDGAVDINDAILLLQYSMFPDLYPLA